MIPTKPHLPCRPALVLATAFCLTIVFAQAQTFTVLRTFTNQGDAFYPTSGLLLDNTGAMYGAAAGGSYDYGAIFVLGPDGKDKVVHSFWGPDGLYPNRLIKDKAGNFYGTTKEGGTPEGGSCFHGCGTVFKMDPSGKVTVLYTFTGGADGSQPLGGLIMDEAGNRYGTTSAGGASYGGVIFKLDPQGHETVLHSFLFDRENGGWYPWGELIRDEEGNFYGVTAAGGPADSGTIFRITPAGDFTTLYNFQGSSAGDSPNGPIIRDSQGNFYGTTVNGGGQFDDGTVFKVDSKGNETILHSFTGGADGATPYTALTRDDNTGNFYGATLGGGSNNCGTIFKVEPNGTESVIYSFNCSTDGSGPYGLLILDQDGNLYGTAYQGGDPACRYGGCGTAFKFAP
ncbi:MAG TPA: choice-of-anchor tandem repeat GloVer-containing protein [Terriglobales bacterium]